MSRVLPILFNGDMVRAILDGRKTVTRRVIKPQPKSKLCYAFAGNGCGTFGYPGKNAWKYWGDEGFMLPDGMGEEELSRRWPPPYHGDDILYVRETYCPDYFDCKNQYGNRHGYKADYDKAVLSSDIPEPKWIPSIHMPKQAARIWLKVTNVRVERLQKITEEQALTEGAIDNRGFIHSPGNEYDNIHSSKEHFKKIWDSTIKKPDIARYGWDANPWVWVIEFERCEKPEPCILNGMEPAEDKRPCIGYQKSKEDDEPCEMCKGCKWCDGEERESEG